MITRRQGREWAIQALVQFDINPPLDIDDALSSFWVQMASLERDSLEDEEFGCIQALTVKGRHDLAALARIKEFAECRVRGAWADREKLDAEITPFLDNWGLYRLGSVERSTLRLGVWELLNCSDIPPAIVINEAVDLVKYFSETKSGRFVNGVLDRFAKSLPSAEGQTAEKPASKTQAAKKQNAKTQDAKKPKAKKPDARKSKAKKPKGRKSNG